MVAAHMKRKPSRETVMAKINAATKIEFDFLLEMNMELVDVDRNELFKMVTC